MNDNRKIELYNIFIYSFVELSSSRADAYNTLIGFGMTDEEIREVEALRDFINESLNDLRISAFVKFKGNSVIFPLPLSQKELCEKLSSIGLDEREAFMLTIGSNSWNVKLMTENSIGCHLIRLISESATFPLLNEICLMLIDSPSAIKPTLSERLISGCYSCVQDLLDDVSVLTSSLGKYTTSFHFPLTGWFGKEFNEEEEVNSSYLLDFKDEIEDLIESKQESDDMTQYFKVDENTRKKVVSIHWDVAKLKDKLYGRVTFRLIEPFTDEEKEIAREWVDGQNSDGFGEGLEEHKIETEDGALYVSLWFNNGDYFVYDEVQMSEYLGMEVS